MWFPYKQTQKSARKKERSGTWLDKSLLEKKGSPVRDHPEHFATTVGEAGGRDSRILVEAGEGKHRWSCAEHRALWPVPGVPFICFFALSWWSNLSSDVGAQAHLVV